MKKNPSLYLVIFVFLFPGFASGQEIQRMDFESVADFSLTFTPWTAFDLDGDSTYGIEGYSFLHDGDPMAFIAFNPSMVTPPMSDPSIQPHSGSRFGACFSSPGGPNDDWMISPRINLKYNGEFSFWARSYTSDYGLEKFRVAVSTTDSLPSSFTFISGSTPLSAATTWTKISYNLSGFSNQAVFVAIQCVSDNAFIFMVDDLEVDPGDTVNQLPASVALDFENLDDFTLDFAPWTVKDVNGGYTYVINNSVFPHNGEPMAFINFNPSKATPPPAHMAAHGGEKFGACFSSEPPNNPNNKWLVSPRMKPGDNAKIAFWVESYNITYGYEKFNVGISTTGNDPSDFTIISGATPDSAPLNWARKFYSLADYANQAVYVGIQCVTDNGFCFMIDDIEIGSSVSLYDDTEDEAITVFPIPARDKLHIDFGMTLKINVTIEIYDLAGKVVKKYHPGEKINGIFIADVSGIDPGLYLIRMHGLHFDVTRKLIVVP